MSSSWEYNRVRCWLLIRTAGFRFLRDKIKKKYKLSKLTTYDQKNKLALSSVINSEGSGKDIKLLAESLRLSEEFIEDAITGWLNKKGTEFVTLPFYVSTDAQRPPDGFYIKVDPYTRLKTVIKTYKHIMFEWEELNKYIDSNSPRIKTSKKDKAISSLKNKVKTFLFIEDYSYKHFNKREKPIPVEILEGERKANPLIEKAMRKALAKLKIPEDKRDQEFKKVKDNYYTLLNYYSIPSSQEFRKLLIKI